MLITPAYAQAAQGAGGADFLTSLIPLVLIFVIFYFLLIRPQQKRAKEHRNMVQNLKRGDQVVTGGGILGKVTRVKEGEEIEVEIAENTRVRVYRSTITAVLAKTEPAKEG
jgi:preprotein translocase subunit YajC